MVTRKSRSRPLPKQQRLDLAMPGAYLGTLDTDDLIRHLAVGDQYQYAASRELEKVFEEATYRAEEKAEEAHNKLFEQGREFLGYLDEQLQIALEDLTFERTSAADFHAKIAEIRAALRKELNESWTV